MKIHHQLREAGYPHGFTLTELLVVLVMVSVLVALALPALAKDKNRAHDTIDLSNHHQILQATHSYAADHNDFLPAPGWGTSDPCWLHGPNFPSPGVGGVGSMAAYGTHLAQQQRTVTNGQLYPYLKSFAVFMCPADLVNPLFLQRNVYVTSYVWNGAVSGYGRLAGTQTYKLSQFKPDRVLQWEADEKWPFYFNDASSFPDEGVSGRHGPLVTLGLFSGGTERIPLSRYYSSEFAGAGSGASIPASLLPNRIWCSPGTANGLQ